jgi:cytochrome P450
MFGRGVLWAEGDDHKKQRRLVAPAFRSVVNFTTVVLNHQQSNSTEAVRDMTRDICDCAERVKFQYPAL